MADATGPGATPERIAVVTTSYPDGPGDPAGHFVATEAEALAADGHIVTVIAAGNARVTAGNPQVVRLADGGATGWPGVVHRLRERPLRALGLLRWMAAARRELARRGPFDRVVAHWLLPAGFPIAFHAAPGARVHIVVHGSDARCVARLPRPLRHVLFAGLEREGAEIRCVSEELRVLVRRLDRNGSRLSVSVAEAPVSLAGTPDRELARRLLGVSPGARLVLVVGRLIAGKRARQALAAASLVPGVEITVVGDGPERRALETEFPHARFTGFLSRDRTLAWIAAADALISASRLEGAPTVVREARALGVPVVARASGDLARWSKTDPGLLVVE